MSQYTSFLFARPSLSEGLARLLDVGGTLNIYNASSTPGCADSHAIKADWLAVGDDLWIALNDFLDEQKETVTCESRNKPVAKTAAGPISR